MPGLVGIHPAQQYLAPDHLTVLGRDLGLHIEIKLLVSYRFAQARLHIDTLARLAGDLGVEQYNGIATAALGFKHGAFRLLYRLLCIGEGIFRGIVNARVEHANADTGGNTDLAIFSKEWPVDYTANFIGQLQAQFTGLFCGFGDIPGKEQE